MCEIFGFVDGRLKAIGQILPSFSLLLVDSGSFVNAVPKYFAPGYPLTPLEDDIEATVANGIRLDCYGTQTLLFSLFGGQSIQVDAFSMDVVRPILSAGALVHAGFTVRL